MRTIPTTYQHAYNRLGRRRRPTDYFQSFIKLGELGIIPLKLAKDLAPSTGLRNRLVHEYDDTDNSIVLAAVKMADDLYPKYISAVEAHIKSTD
ncbi:MAG: DUF86 domain-containing protein [Thermodesulfobacteriota bacterium]|nr:MAG: DUF86 domain-containing protein [Thermodesulfobacteriota bacterium]